MYCGFVEPEAVWPENKNKRCDKTLSFVAALLNVNGLADHNDRGTDFNSGEELRHEVRWVVDTAV